MTQFTNGLQEDEEAESRDVETKEMSSPWDIWSATIPSNLSDTPKETSDTARQPNDAHEIDGRPAEDGSQKELNATESQVALISDDNTANSIKTQEAPSTKANEAHDPEGPMVKVNYDEDTDDEKAFADPPSREAGTNNEQQQASRRRYEIWNWFRHLRCAEKAAGREDPKTGGLWDDVWLALRTFLLNPSRFRAWCSAMVAGLEGDESLWRRYWFMGCTGRADWNVTPFHVCTSLGLTWVLQRMVIEGANLQVQTVWGELPIHWLEANATLNDDLDLVKLLLDHNDLNYQSPKEQAQHYAFNTLMWADPSVEVLKAMVQSGARHDVASWLGRSMLHLAAQFSSRPAVASYFIELGLEINALGESHWKT